MLSRSSPLVKNWTSMKKMVCRLVAELKLAKTIRGAAAGLSETPLSEYQGAVTRCITQEKNAPRPCSSSCTWGSA